MLSASVRKILAASACAATALSLATPAWAADDDVATVEIKAQRQAFRGDVPLNELPQSVQVLDAQILKDVNVVQLDDVLDLASGLARQNTFGGLWDAFAIRGFAGDENTPTGYLVNGFNVGRGFSGRRDTVSVESVEVLKGPGSALYGRAEPGGTVNLVTKKPKFDSQGSIELAAARYNNYRVAADYTAPITDSIAFRINGAYEDSESFRDFITYKKYVVNPSFLFKLGDSTTITYEGEFLNQKAPFDRGVVAPFGQLGAVDISTFLGEPGDGETEIKANGHQLVLNHDFNDNWTMLVGFGYRKSTFEGFSSDPELVGSRQPFYTTGTTLSRQRRQRDYEAEDNTVRAELAGTVATGGLTHHLMMGVDYYKYELDTVQLRFRPTLANPYAVDVFNPVYGQTRTPGAFVDTLEKQDATGIYIQDQIDVTEQWKLLLGVRYDSFKQTILNRRTSTTSRQKDNATSPRVGLVYEVSERFSVYTSYSKGFRPNSGSDATGTAFSPEFSKSIEIGTKFSTEGGGISGTVAVYQGKKSNFLTADPVNAGFSLAAGKAESKGLEIDLAGSLPGDLRYTFSYAYTDAEITESILDFNFGLSLPAGTPLINIPKNSANLLVMKAFDLGVGRFTVGGGLNYVSDRVGETGTPSFVLPSYTLARLTASYAPNEALKFTVDVENLFDKEYYASSYHRLWVAPGTPRTWTVRMQYSFGK